MCVKDSSLLCWLRQICCLNKQADASDKVYFQCSGSLYEIKSVTLQPAHTNTCSVRVCTSPWWSVSELPAMGELCSRQPGLLKAHVCSHTHCAQFKQNHGAFWAAWKIKVSYFTMPAGTAISWVMLCSKGSSDTALKPIPSAKKLVSQNFRNWGVGGRVVIFSNEKTIGKWSYLWDPTDIYHIISERWTDLDREGEWVTKIADDTKLFRILKPEADFGDLQNYFMVLSDRAMNEKADKQ